MDTRTIDTRARPNSFERRMAIVFVGLPILTNPSGGPRGPDARRPARAPVRSQLRVIRMDKYHRSARAPMESIGRPGPKPKRLYLRLVRQGEGDPAAVPER